MVFMGAILERLARRGRVANPVDGSKIGRDRFGDYPL